MLQILVKSILHNVGVVAVGLGFAFVGMQVDELAGWRALAFPLGKVFATILLAMGFLLRVWATYSFYKNNMRVIRLEAQGTLLTTGPFRFIRSTSAATSSFSWARGCCLARLRCLFLPCCIYR